MSEKQKQSLRKQEIRSETWNMPSKVAKELFGICDADRDEPPRTAEVEVDHAVMKEPSKSRTNKTKYVIRLTPLDYVSTPHTNNFEMLLQKIVPKEVAASRVLREVGFSGSEIPATMAAAFPNPTKGGQQSNEKESDEGAAAQHPGASTSKSTTKSPTTKTLLGDAIAAKLLAMERTTRTTHEKEHHPKLSYTWNLDFRKHNLSGNTGNKFVTKETCRDLIEKQLEKTFAKSSSQDKEEKMDSSIPGRQISFSVDITCPDFLFVVEVTPTFLGMSVLQDVEQWRDFKLFENDKENESEEERSCSAASDVDGEDGAGCTSGSEGEDGDLQTASEDEEKAVDA
ncbi:unnamed protein product [Amoebophrya sp. A120]|nr:unnamed protein product [Amoebophrya sp. A120]|eukprot:GSA120T00024485001.1